MKKQTKAIIFLLILLSGAWIFSVNYNNSIKTEIDENRFETVAKIYDVKYGAKNVSLKYKFRYKGKIYLSGKPLDKIDKEKFINKYFRIEISIKNPNRNRIFLDQEITSDRIKDSINL